MTGQYTERTTQPGAKASGSIYDLGYQHYEGPRLGRSHAIQALWLDGIRACFGIGRPGRAKIVPIGLLVIALVPAVIAVGVEAISNGVVPDPIRYDNYFSTIVQIVILFVAAQAPELVGRDQRYHVLSLYFTRALERLDYALAKLAALVSALLILTLSPQLAIFLGKVMGASDTARALSDNAADLPAIVLSALAAAIVMAGISLAIAAYTPRRAYATAAIFAAFYVAFGVSEAIAHAATGEAARYAILLAPATVIDGVTAWLFGTTFAVGRGLDFLPPDPEFFVGMAVVLAFVSIGAMLWRYRRIGA